MSLTFDFCLKHDSRVNEALDRSDVKRAKQAMS